MNNQKPFPNSSGANYVKSAIFLVSSYFMIFISLYTGYLVVRRQPLPINNLSQSSIVLVLFTVLCIFVVIYLARLPLISYPIVYLIGTFLYTASVFVVYLFTGWNAFQNYRITSLHLIELGIPVVMLAFSSFTLGVILSLILKPSTHIPNKIHSNEDVDLNLIRKIALVIFWFAVIIIGYYSVRGQGLSLMFSGGYSRYTAVLAYSKFPPLIAYSLAYFLPWSTVLLLATSQNYRSFRLSAVMAILSSIIYLLTGDRANPVTFAFLTLGTAYLLGMPINWRQILVIFFIVAVFITSWNTIRQTPISEWSSDFIRKEIVSRTIGTVSNSSSRLVEGINNFTVNVFSETSSCYETLIGTMYFVPNFESFRYGQDYFRAMIIAIPFLPSSGLVNTSLQPTYWITVKLSHGGMVGYGFLQVGEAYLNFGAVGVAMMYLLLGWLLPRFWWILNCRKVSSKYLAFHLMFMYGLYHWIRSDATDFFRALAFGFILVYLLPLCLNIISKKRFPQSPTHQITL